MKKPHFQPSPDLLKRSPLITTAGRRLLTRLLEHPDAPRWNHSGGDRLQRADLKAVENFAEALATRRRAFEARSPSARIRRWLRGWRVKVQAFRERMPAALDWEKNWASIPTMSREDAAVRPEK